jgi:hypothetical protein
MPADGTRPVRYHPWAKIGPAEYNPRWKAATMSYKPSFHLLCAKKEMFESGNFAECLCRGQARRWRRECRRPAIILVDVEIFLDGFGREVRAAAAGALGELLQSCFGGAREPH